MNQDDKAKADKPSEALADLELTATEGKEINGGATGGVIPVYMHVIRAKPIDTTE